MNKFLILLFILFGFTNSTYAQVGDLACEEISEAEQLARDSRSIAARIANPRQCPQALTARNFLEIGIGCLSGTRDSVVALWDGFVSILKLLVVDAPAAAYGGARRLIQGLVNGNLNPLEMASAIANVNLGSQSDLWRKAQGLWNAFQTYMRTLGNQLARGYDGFNCMPLRRQSRIMCRGVSEFALFFLGPGAVARGIPTAVAIGRKAGQVAAALSREVATVATRQVTRAAVTVQSSARAVDRGVRAGVAAARDSRVVVSTGRNGNVVRRTLADGSEIHQSETFVMNNGRRTTVTREIPMDVKTGAIDSNTEVGRAVLVNAVTEQAGKGSILFVDVNHLGRVNYFTNGTRGGDEYLEAVAASMRSVLRPGDMIYKNGGDELVVVLANNTPEAVQQVSQRMIDAVAANPTIRDIFRREVTVIRDRYRSMNSATSLEDMPDDIRRALPASDIQRAAGDFPAFKQQMLNTYVEALQSQATFRGSVSLGSSMIRHGEDLAGPLSRAEAQASLVKTRYKSALGHDVDKYNVDDVADLDQINPEAMVQERWPEPVALPTVP